MARSKHKNLENSFDSVYSHLNIVIKQLDDLRMKATRDYTKAIKVEDPAEISILEATRNNSMKTLENYFKMRIECMSIHQDLVVKEKGGNLKEEELKIKIGKKIGNIEDEAKSESENYSNNNKSLTNDIKKQMNALVEEAKKNKDK